MKTIKFSPTSLRSFVLVCLAGIILAGFTQVFGKTNTVRLQDQPLSLNVPVVKQAWSTSCGEAVIAMTYNYAYPDSQITEGQVIEYASARGYYTPDRPPFTSPASMVKIAEYYAEDVSTGKVTTSSQGLDLLVRKLRDGEPVIIDVLSNFSDLESEAHFVVVTGISTDPNREEAVLIHYNDPLTGTKKTADWDGPQGVWNAWLMNGDPGGPGWWLVISHH